MIGTLTNFLRNGTTARTGVTPTESSTNDGETDHTASQSTDAAPETDTETEPVSELQWGLLADKRSDPTAESTSDDRTATTTDGPPESVASALVEEFRRGAVSEEERSVLREELGFDSPSSVDVRLRHLQSEVADFQAYTDALEEFVDENGTAEQLATDLRRRIDDLDARLDDVERLRDDIAAVEDSHTEDIRRLDNRIGGVAKTLTDSLLALRADVRTVSEDLKELNAWRRSVNRAFGSEDASDR